MVVCGIPVWCHYTIQAIRACSGRFGRQVGNGYLYAFFRNIPRCRLDLFWADKSAFQYCAVKFCAA